MSVSEDIRRGEQARQLIENEIYKEAIDKVKQGIIDKWMSAPLRDREGHHELKIMLKLLDEVTGYINTTMETGKLSYIQLESDRRMEKLRKVGL